MGFKMKGPSMYNGALGKNLKVQKNYAGQADGRATSSPFQDHVKGAKTVEDYLNEGFSQVEAQQMHKEGGVTGKPGKPAPPTKFLGGLLGKVKDVGGRMLKGKDGKFGWGDAARLATGGIGGAAAGLFYKEEEAKKNTNTKKKETTTYTKANPHPMAGSKNAKGTKVIDFKGNWKVI